MDFALTESQRMLQRSARDFLEGKVPMAALHEMEAAGNAFPSELWRAMASLGWQGLVIPEEHSGVGQGLVEMGIVLEELGRSALSSPFLHTVVFGALGLMQAGTPEQRAELLPRIAAGELIVSLGLPEVRADYEPGGVAMTAHRDGAGYVLEGVKLFVPYAGVADVLLTAARTTPESQAAEGLTLFLVDARSPGINAEPIPTIGKDHQYEVRFQGVRVPEGRVLGPIDGGWPVMDGLLLHAMALQSAQMVGGAQRVMEMTTEYVKRRVQFGRPIGTFQSARHSLAYMMMDVDGARLLTYRALWKLAQGEMAAVEVAAAKAWTGEAFRKATETAHHLHGGVGVTLDYGLHYYSRKAKAEELALGSAHAQRRRLARELEL